LKRLRLSQNETSNNGQLNNWTAEQFSN